MYKYLVLNSLILFLLRNMQTVCFYLRVCPIHTSSTVFDTYFVR